MWRASLLPDAPRTCLKLFASQWHQCLLLGMIPILWKSESSCCKTWNWRRKLLGTSRRSVPTRKKKKSQSRTHRLRLHFWFLFRLPLHSFCLQAPCHGVESWVSPLEPHRCVTAVLKELKRKVFISCFQISEMQRIWDVFDLFEFQHWIRDQSKDNTWDDLRPVQAELLFESNGSRSQAWRGIWTETKQWQAREFLSSSALRMQQSVSECALVQGCLIIPQIGSVYLVSWCIWLSILYI